MKHALILAVFFLTASSLSRLSAQDNGLCPIPVGEITSHGNGDESWVWHEDQGVIVLKGDNQYTDAQPILQGPWPTINFSALGIAGERWALDLVEDTIVVALRTSESINLQKIDALTGSFIGESYSIPGSLEGSSFAFYRFDHEKQCVAVEEFEIIRIHDSRTGDLLWNVDLGSIPSGFDNVLDYDWDNTHAYVITEQQGSSNKLSKFNLSTGLWQTSIETSSSKLSVYGDDESNGSIFLNGNGTFMSYAKSLEVILSIPSSSMHYNGGSSSNVRLRPMGDYIVCVYKQIEAFNFGDDSWVYPSGYHLIVIINPNTLEIESLCLLSTPNANFGSSLNTLQVNDSAIGFVSFEESDWGSAFVVTLGNQTVGCTDENACNYLPTSFIDDGSCQYLELEEIQGQPYPEPFSTEVYTYAQGSINSFEWSVNNGIIEQGQGSNEISVYWGTGFGNISINVTDANGCSGTVDFDVLMLPADINEVERPSISLAPNPASNWVQVSGINVEASRFLSVYNLQGRLILRYQVESEKSLLDISHLEKGVYLVQSSSREKQRLVVN